MRALTGIRTVTSLGAILGLPYWDPSVSDDTCVGVLPHVRCCARFNGEAVTDSQIPNLAWGQRQRHVGMKDITDKEEKMKNNGCKWLSMGPQSCKGESCQT